MDENELLLGSTPPEYMFVPIIGAVIVIGCAAWHVVSCRRDGKHLGIGSLIWSVLISAALIFLAVWCGNQFMSTDVLYLTQCVVVLTTCGSILAQRERVFKALDDLDSGGTVKRGVGQVIRALRDVGIILLGSELARRAIEVPWNGGINELGTDNVAIEFTIIAIAAFIAYFVLQRRSLGPAIVFGSCIAIGLIEHFVLQFRRAAILPTDLLALQTATEVSDSYSYILNTFDIKAIMYGGLALLFVSFIRPARATGAKRFVYNLCWNLPFALAFGLALSWWISVPNYHEGYGLKINYWNTVESYKKQGFLPSFLTAAEDLPIEVPIGYTDEKAQKITKSYAAKADAMPERSARRSASTAQFKQIKPSVIVVMNETFADLSRLDNLHGDYQGPTFFREGLSDTLMRGQLGVSTFGGGTCNTEFECLTGNSIAFIGYGKYPYQMFSFVGVPNLARQFADMGYTPTAIHPNGQDNWNRRATYRDMGFDEFYNIDNSFEEAPALHSGITDRATYEKCLEVLKSSDKPQFIFDVTMQNHGGYEQGNIPPERLTTYEFEGLNERDTSQFNEYLSCIQASDEDLEWFVNELRNVDRPVVLAFFGDHHPAISSIANDVFFADEDPETIGHQSRIYQTEYAIWANYNVAGTGQVNQVDDFGADLLGARILDLMGAPLDPFQSAQLAVHQRIQVVTGIGLEGTDGRWHDLNSAPSLDATFRDLQNMDYLRFGSKLAGQGDAKEAEGSS